MCGICGLAGMIHPEEAMNRLKRMNDTLIHRGPDDEGTHVEAGVALAMRRLSIIDLAGGHQPMTDETGTIWAIQNGEIYNFPELRRLLEGKGHRFASRSDTEVILHGYQEWGEEVFSHLAGMFAIAIWDAPNRTLLLGRDRLGKKPLYYADLGGRIVFGSEIKALLASGWVSREIDPEALDAYLTFEYVPGPMSIFRSVRKLPPGHLLAFRDGRVAIRPYWDLLAEAARRAPSADPRGELDALIDEAVRCRMIADVPLGAFLSGGLDSSTVVSYMVDHATEPVQTYSIGFGEGSYDEVPYAELIAKRFGLAHHVRRLDPDIAGLARLLAGFIDEPMADTSIFPTYLLAKTAREGVTVALSGDGGDELMAGYETYRAHLLARPFGLVPRPLRRLASRTAELLIAPREAKKGTWNNIRRFAQGLALPADLGHARWRVYQDEAAKAALYQGDLRPYASGAAWRSITTLFDEARDLDAINRLLYVDLKSFLVDDIMVKVDRMTMAVSLESRAPLLDHRLAEFLFSLPGDVKLRRGVGKAILKDVVRPRLPAEVIDRPKEGFSIPMKNWLRGPLAGMARELLSPASIGRLGMFDQKTVDRLLAGHLSGREDHAHRIWPLMHLVLWAEAWR
jgi:asparagine synthase (glutamine-hydrolysing)